MRTVLFGGAIAVSVLGGSPDHPEVDRIGSKPVVAAPADRSRWDGWRTELSAARQRVRRVMDYDDELYRRKEFGWVPSCYACCFVMMCVLFHVSLLSFISLGRAVVDGPPDIASVRFGNSRRAIDGLLATLTIMSRAVQSAPGHGLAHRPSVESSRAP